jgi:serine protease Do
MIREVLPLGSTFVPTTASYGSATWRQRLARHFICNYLPFVRAFFLSLLFLLARLAYPEVESAENKTSPAEGAATNQFPAAPKPFPASRYDLPGAFRQVVPSSLDDLQAIQAQVEALAVRLAPAVVEVEVGMGSGSGVVISEDGLVLTAAHVCGTPNLDVVFTFPNGKKAHGKTLGTNHDMDAGLMKITDAGPWPRVETGELGDARLGDWVLALGHPGGFDPERSMVVRLGRLLRLGPGLLQTDCTLIGGDSGGPLFDMHGRVIGIHSRISNSTRENYHIPISAYYSSWDRLVRCENWGGRRSPPRSYLGALGEDDPQGCRLARVDANSPASKAGLKVGDLVRKFNDLMISDAAAFLECIWQTEPGEVVFLEIMRGDLTMSVRITVANRRGRWRFGP